MNSSDYNTALVMQSSQSSESDYIPTGANPDPKICTKSDFKVFLFSMCRLVRVQVDWSDINTTIVRDAFTGLFLLS